MKCITLHFPLAKNPDFNLASWLAKFSQIDRFPEVEDDQQDYLNLNFFSEQPKEFWESIKSIVESDAGHSVIVTCEDLEFDDDPEIFYENTF